MRGASVFSLFNPYVLLGAVIGAALLAASSFAFGYRYADNRAEVARLNSLLAFEQLQREVREALDEDGAMLAAAMATEEAHNQAKSDEIDARTQGAPIIDGCISAEFLAGLRQLR